MVRGVLLFLMMFEDPRPAVTEYPVHAQMEKAALGADYQVHSVFARGGNVLLQDYLAVEVGLYPNKGVELKVAIEQFALRLDGKKDFVLAQSPGFVAAAQKHPDWERRRHLEAAAGMGDAGVIVGQPRPTERFPGDPRPQQTRLPAPPRAPQPEDRSGQEKTPPRTPEEMIAGEALQEGEFSKPVRGYVYFPYKGKQPKTVEMIYNGPAGSTTLKLR
jgi:hypothetical protein